MTDWVEIAVPLTGQADPGALEEVAALVATAIPDASAGVEMRVTEVVFWVPRERGDAAVQAARRVAENLSRAGLPLVPSEVVTREAVPEAEWRDAWKRYFRTIRLTRQIVVVPSWDTHDPSADDLVVHLDPGQAFGTGAHESTRLILRILQGLSDGGARASRVLDLGTGSGILALAAALFWPGAAVTAVDSDPIAVTAARENAEANRLTERVEASTSPLEAIAGRFDVVLANIQADVLTALAVPLAERVAPGGWLVLSGLLAHQAEPIAQVYAGCGLAIEAIRPGEEDAAWSAVLLRCCAS